MDGVSRADQASAEQASAIAAVNLQFGWGNRTVVKEWSLALSRGECAALVGPNGAGKTTLLRLLSGTLRPERGEVFYKGVPAQSLSGREIARRVAVVPQDFHLPFDFTAAQVVEQGRTPFRRRSLSGRELVKRSDKEIIEASMARTGSWELRDRIFNELSGGERQRVRIAMALAQTPELMLLDEPLQNLDLAWQGEILTLIYDLSQTGVTAIAAIHDLNLVQPSCFTSALLIDPKQGLLQGTLAEVLEQKKLENAFGTGLECVERAGGVRFVLPASVGCGATTRETVA
jgi:iron complex transport system ATP-binding protein